MRPFRVDVRHSRDIWLVALGLGDGLGNLSEERVHRVPSFCARLEEELGLVLFRQVLSFGRLDTPLGLEIDLVPDDDNRAVLLGPLLEDGVERLEALGGLRVGHIVDENSSFSTLEVDRSEAPEALLTGGVPEVKDNSFPIDVNIDFRVRAADG